MPVCNNELWVCACDEFSAIPPIERRSRTGCAYHEVDTEEEPRSNIALVVYRSTSLQTGLSPAEMFMSRRLRTRQPILRSPLKPGDSQSLERKEVYVVQTSSDTSTYDTMHATHQRYNLAILFGSQRPKPSKLSCSHASVVLQMCTLSG